MSSEPTKENSGGILALPAPIVEETVSSEEIAKTEKTNDMSESLMNLQKYNSDSSGSSDSDDDSEDSEEDSESESEDDDSEDEIKEKQGANTKRKDPHEEESWLSILGVDKVSTELPDISSLDLNNKDPFVHMGNFESVIDKIVTVAALPHLPAYDLDTLLFLEEGKKVLGYIFDVMGPVTAPVYIIPVSSVEAIKDLQLEKGTKVYCAPRSKYTKYILLQELINVRGSDASGVGDIEVPLEFQEFSDDEQERLCKKDTKRKRIVETEPNMDQLPGGRPTTVHRPGRPSRPQFRNNAQHGGAASPVQNNRTVLNPAAVATQNFNNVPMMMPPAFDPSVPPPNFGAPQFYAPPVGGRAPPFYGPAQPPNFAPRGMNYNRSPNRPNFRQNMPGPTNGNWFN